MTEKVPPPPLAAVTASLLLLLVPLRRKVSPTIVLAGLSKTLPHTQAWFKAQKLAYPAATIKQLQHAIHLGKTNSPAYFAKLQAFYKANKLGVRMKKKADADHTQSAGAVKLFNTTLSMFAAREMFRLDSIEARLVPQILSQFKTSPLRKLWRTEVVSQVETLQKMTKLVHRMTGQAAVLLPKGAATTLKGGKFDTHLKEYQKLRAAAKLAYENAVRAFIHESGAEILPVKDVRKLLKDAGITLHPLTADLDPLSVGDDLKLYTKAGKRIDAFPVPGSKITWNPDYDPIKDEGWIFKFQPPDAINEQWAYTSGSKKARAAKKYEAVDAAIDMLKPTRQAWVNLLVSTNRRQTALGTMAELLYSVALRVGDPKNKDKDGNPTYGLTTLRVKEVTFRDDGTVLIRYPGKKGTPQKHKLRPNTNQARLVINNLKRFVAGKKPTEYVFTDAAGVRITRDDINAYVKGVLKMPITAHKFRHLRATQLFRQLDAASPLPASADQRRAEDHFKEMVTKIGAALGHLTAGGKVPWTTAMSAYLNPKLAAEWFNANSKRVPDYVTKQLKEDE